MQARKKQLQEAALEYLLKLGVANLSLRPLAAALGTSARILLFHFKSKEGLLADVLEELNAQLLASFGQLAAAAPSRGAETPLERFWHWATRKENIPHLRLLYELQIIAAQNPAEYGRFWKKISLDWQSSALGATSAEFRSESLATLCIAVFDGLFLELVSTGDRARLTRALEHFVAMAKRSG